MLIRINTFASAPRKELCESLLGLHAYVGCNTVSAFSQGQLQGFKRVCQNKGFQKTFTELGTHWDLSMRFSQQCRCSHVACLLLDLQSVNWTNSATSCREQRKGQWNPVNCHNVRAVKLHCMRTNYQAAAWKHSFISNPNVPFPENHGWTSAKDGKVEIQWMAGSPAPSVILKFIFCKCSHKC